MQEKIKGITLKATVFKENSRIIQVFSKDLGIISILIKRISSKKTNLLSLSSPFCYGEFILKKSKGDITSFSTAISRVLGKYVVDYVMKDNVCPLCGKASLSFDEVCIKCLECDY